MANIKKSFNFRNGVQVDNDNFIVNANGLVGIGSTIPTQSLDVAGNVKIRGTLFADFIEGKIVNTSEDGTALFTKVNVGITSITSGIITATTGIVTYYGDGSNLQGLPTSQWIDVDPTLNGYESIYSAGNVGIATTNPIYTFQIGTETDGVGISSDGDVYIGRYLYVNGTGISTFSGNLYVSGTGISTFVGVLTAYSLSGFGTNIIGINASNISTGTLDNARLASDINKSTGIATFKEFHGDLVGIASTARGLTTDANIDIVSIVSDYSNLGVTTVSTLYASGNIGFGTEIPNSSVQLRKTSNATLEVTSDIDASRIIIGRKNYKSNFNESNSFGIIRFGNTDSLLDFNKQSTEDSFDIINYAPGNVNTVIRPGDIPDLKFNWINYSTNTILASLTSGGRFGIGITNPTETFEVVGTSTITSHSYVGGDFNVTGSITGDSLTITQSSTFNGATFNKKVSISTESTGYSLEIGSPFTLNAEGTSGTGVGIGSVGNINASGTIRANKFIGIGSQITQISPSNISSGTLGDISINTTTGIITANKFIGIGSQITQISPSNISSGTLGDININTATGIITAKEFVGIGSQITQISPSNISSGTLGDISINTTTGIITASKFVGDGSGLLNVSASQITGINLYNGEDEVGIAKTIVFTSPLQVSTFSSGIATVVSSNRLRTKITQNTGSINSSESKNIDYSNGFRTYSLLKIDISHAAWVILYTDSSSRTDDVNSGRTYPTSPTPHSGVIAEVYTTNSGSNTFKISPSIIGWNDDSPVTSKIYVRVVNNESSTVSGGIDVDLTIVELEDVST